MIFSCARARARACAHGDAEDAVHTRRAFVRRFPLQPTDRSVTPIQHTRNKLAKIYAAGIVAFVAFFGTVTLLARFLEHVNMG